MDISLYLINYLQSRVISNAGYIELYIADNLKNNTSEIIIKDNAEKINEVENLPIELQKLSDIADEISAQFKHLYHRKSTTIQIEWSEKKDISLDSFHSLIGMLSLNTPKTQIIFSYFSKKGEYVYDSKKVFMEFTPEELMQKEILVYMNELLNDHLNDVRDTL